MVDELNNWDIIHEFLRIWEKPANLEGNDQLAIVPCQLAYGIGRDIKHVSTVAHVWVKSGKVSLLDSKWLNADDYYSEFDVRWQKFALTPGRALRIEGSGPKLGPYWVEIAPQISN